MAWCKKVKNDQKPKSRGGGSCLKEVRGNFAILFWLPCATWHRVMTHTHHTYFDRPTLFFATQRQGRYSRPSSGFLLHPGGLSFGFQARSTGSARTNKRRRFQKSSVVDWMMFESEEWIRRKRRRRRSIDKQASGCMVDLLNLSWAVLCSRQCGLSFFVLVDLGNEQSFVYFGGGGLQPKTPVGADNVDSSMSIWWVYSQSASQHFFGSVVLQSSISLSCTYALGEWTVVSHRWSRRTPAGFCVWSNQRGYFTERGRKNWTFTKSELLLHRQEATAPALAKQNLCCINALFMEDFGLLFKDPEPLIFFDNELMYFFLYMGRLMGKGTQRPNFQFLFFHWFLWWI